jgi:cytochrome c biogenesis protein
MQESKVARQPDKGFVSIIFDLFRSLKLTIALLIVLAILSIVGTIITQNASEADYIERYGLGLYEILNFFSLFDMYHSWWFSAILALLVLNLVACTFERFPAVWRQVFHGSQSEELQPAMLKTLAFVEKMKSSGPIDGKTVEEMEVRTGKRFGHPKRFETESSVTFFSEKGRFSRFGVPITHVSILIILIGGLLGSVYGFKGFVNILEGETVDQIYLRTKKAQIPKPLGFSVRCDDFKVSYYNMPGKEKYVKEYVSDLTILENGRPTLSQKVAVNHPLHYRGLAFYQSSYGALNRVAVGVQFKDQKEKTLLSVGEGETVRLPRSASMLRVLQYMPQVHNLGEGAQVALMQPNQEPRLIWLLKGFPNLDQQRGWDFVLSFEGVDSKEYTGLQVTKDPGVSVVWFGCGTMILGLILSFFFSHQRVWLNVPKNPGGEILLAGSTNKNRIGFESRFGQWVESIRSAKK